MMGETFAESFSALGTTATVVVTESTALPVAVSMLRQDLDDLDLTCSRFRDDSEVRRAERAHSARFTVSPLLAEHLDAALRAAALTAGLVDPTVGGSLVDLGYDRDFALVRMSIIRAARPCPAPGWQQLCWDPINRTLTVPADVHVDLGSTAKALCADQAAGKIADEVPGGVLVSLGGDVAVGGTAPDPDGWLLNITDDHEQHDADGQIVTLRSGGIATSGTTRRRWVAGGQRLHHIVDPRTGRPADGPWRTVSVAAASCLDANIASTAAVVLGADAAGWLSANRLPARLVDHAGAVHTVAGWPSRAPGPTPAGAG
jgi:FAD:protein FMN transferase